MGQELDLNDKSSVGLSPNTILSSHQYCLNVKKTYRNRKPTGKFHEDFGEIKFARFSSSSCKSLPCRSHRLERDIEKRRGSMYQSSGRVINIKKFDPMEGRKKIEISCRSSDTSFSSSIVDSLCGSDDEASIERPSVICQDSVLGSPSPSVSGSWAFMEHKASNGFIELCINADVWDKKSSAVEGIGSVNSKTVTRNMTCQRSLLNDFTNTAKHADIISEFVNRDIKYSGLACSPVHLHGNLKLKNKQGLPYFEFKVKCPEDVFVAKTWRGDNAFSWVYTFHSIANRKKSNAGGLGSQYCDKDSSMVAQMLVSYNLCSELEDGVFGNSMVTEFVLYDSTHSRKSVSPKEKSNRKQNVSKTLKASSVGVKGETFRPDEKIPAIKNKLLSGNFDFGSSNSYPLSSKKLHSNLESAAIVLQIPFHKRESLKYKRGDRITTRAYSKPSDLSSALEHNRKNFPNSKVPEQVKVVLSTGNHGLPSAKSQGPSSLLDRWKHGGGCDCGGWDMACPLILLGNPGIQFAEDRPLMEKHQPLELFSQGTKESIPTFGMTLVEEGQYAVDFHAQLSPLQAFSICVAILHGTSAFSAAAGQEKNQRLSQCNSWKMLIKEEVEFLIKSVTTEEKKTVSNIKKGIPRSYVLNPPFSPIARV